MWELNTVVSVAVGCWVVPLSLLCPGHSQSSVVCVWPSCADRSFIFECRGCEFESLLRHVLTT